MTDTEKENPYRPPASETGSQPEPTTIKISANVWRLFVIPFFLAHLVYWPIFFISSTLGAVGPHPHSAIGGLFFGLMIGSVATIVAGFCYGFWLGSKVRAEQVAAQPVMLYAIGQAIWFAFSLFAPCGVLALGTGM